MAFDYHDTLERIVAKANVVSERYQVLLESKNEAIAKIESLEEQIAQKDKELERLRLEVEYLRVASVISPTREHVDQAKAMISALVRKIDLCINDLSE